MGVYSWTALPKVFGSETANSGDIGSDTGNGVIEVFSSVEVASTSGINLTAENGKIWVVTCDEDREISSLLEVADVIDANTDLGVF